MVQLNGDQTGAARAADVRSAGRALAVLFRAAGAGPDRVQHRDHAQRSYHVTLPPHRHRKITLRFGEVDAEIWKRVDADSTIKAQSLARAVAALCRRSSCGCPTRARTVEGPARQHPRRRYRRAAMTVRASQLARARPTRWPPCCRSTSRPTVASARFLPRTIADSGSTIARSSPTACSRCCAGWRSLRRAGRQRFAARARHRRRRARTGREPARARRRAVDRTKRRGRREFKARKAACFRRPKPPICPTGSGTRSRHGAARGERDALARVVARAGAARSSRQPDARSRATRRKPRLTAHRHRRRRRHRTRRWVFASPASLRCNRIRCSLPARSRSRTKAASCSCFLVAPRRTDMVVDFCAGAGGKTLLLGALMRSQGRALRVRRLAARGWPESQAATARARDCRTCSRR